MPPLDCSPRPSLLPLLDLRFRAFLTLGALGFVYVVLIVVETSLIAGSIAFAFHASLLAGWLALVAAPLVWTLAVILTRIHLELIAVVFRIAHDTTCLATRAESARRRPDQPDDIVDLFHSPEVANATGLSRRHASIQEKNPMNETPHRSPLLAFALAPLLLTSAATADLNVEIVASPNPPRPGEQMDIEIVVTNDGAFTANDVTVNLLYPVGLAQLFESYFDANCPSSACEGGEVAVFTVPSLAPGTGRQFSIPAIVVPEAENGQIIAFDVDVVDDGRVQSSASTEVIVDAARGLELALEEDQDPVTPGETLTYTIDYGVLETSPGALDVTLGLPLPPGTTVLDASDGGTVDAGVVTWALGNLGPGATGERRVTVEVDEGLDTGAILTTEALLESGSGATVTHATATRVQDAPGIALEVTASPDAIRQGEVVDLELTLTNTGVFALNGVAIQLELPQGFVQLFESNFDGDCASSACEAQERATFTVGTLASGAGTSFSIPMRVSAGTPTGTVVPIEAEVTDVTGVQVEAGTSLTVDGARALELGLAADRDPVAPGGAVVFEISYGVLATMPGANGADLTFMIPGGTTVVGASHGGAIGAETVTWALGSISPGRSGERSIVLAVDANMPIGSILEPRAVLDDASGRQTRYEMAVRVQEAFAMELRVVASPDVAQPGETLDVEFTVTNTGVFDIEGLLLDFEIPEDMAQIFETNHDGDCPSSACEPTESARFTIGSLAAGAGQTYSVPLRLSDGTADGTSVPFEVRAMDVTGMVRTSGSVVTVDDMREFDLALVESDDPVAPGDEITYTLTYGRYETVAGANGTVLRFEPPAGTIVTYTSHGANIVGGAVEWPVGSVGPGNGGDHVVRVMVDGAVAPGTVLDAFASIVEGGDPQSEVRFLESTRVATEQLLDVELTVSANPAGGGTTLALVVSVTNDDTFAHNFVELLLEWPDDIAQLFDSEFGGDCPSSACESGERAIFSIPEIAAGETVSFDVPPLVHGASLDGTVINFDVFASDATGFQSADGDAVMVGANFDRGIGGDFDADGDVDVTDLVALILAWGTCDDADACPQDIDGNGEVDVVDLVALITNWG